MSVATLKRVLKSRISPKTLRKRKQILDESKKPLTDDPHIGVEIEFVSTAKEKQVYDVFAKLGLHEYVTITDDGSIDLDADPYDGDSPLFEECALDFCFGCEKCKLDYDSYEITICAPESKIKRILNKVEDALVHIDAKVNTSCGLHIHIDHREVTGRNPFVTYPNLARMEDFLFSIVDPSRAENKFCDPVNSSEFAIQFADQISDDNRYYSINTLSLEKHKTIEVRLFHATIRAEEIYHFIQLVLGAVKSKKIDFKVSKVSHLKKIKYIPKKTVDYVSKKSRGRAA